MDPKKLPNAPPADWNPGHKPDVDQPPPYQDYGAGYNPPPGYPNQPVYPQDLPYGAHYSQRYEGHFQPLFAGQQIVTVQPTVFVTAGAKREPDYLCYSIFTMLCCCLPLGIAALVFSIKTRDANLSGDNQRAKKNSQTACMLNSAAVAIGIVLFVANCLRLIYSMQHI
ncbi:hypothetical protein MHYP_G00286740 [Metynnis hypsauchen]